MAQTAEIIEDGSQDERTEHPDIQQPSVTQNKKWLCLIYFGLAFGLLLAVGSGLRLLVPAFTAFSQCEVVSVYEGDHTQQTESSADKPNKCCPDLWIKRRKNCYYFSVNKTTWEKSNWQCGSHGSQLAAAEDEEDLDLPENACKLRCWDFLIDYCRSYFTFWIGLKRNPKESWTWINQQLFNLSWKTQIKEDGGDCAFVRRQSIQSKACSTDLHWVCKKPLEHCE